MEENLNPHFSKKVLFLSILFLMLSVAWYALAVFSQQEQVYRSVAPKIVFAEAQDVQVKTLYDEAFLSAIPNQSLIAGTQIETDALEFAEIVLENNVVRLDENTKITLKENNFAEYSTYETDLPRLVFELEQGTVWVNAFDRIEILTNRSSAQFSHSVGIMTYAEPMNRVMVVTGSSDLEFYADDGSLLTTYSLPLYNQVTYVDTQIVPEYSRLRTSKLKKELKLAPIADSILKDEWVVRNTMVDNALAESKLDLIDSSAIYALKDNYYKVRAFLTFVPESKRELILEHTSAVLGYLLGNIHSENKLFDAKELIVYLDDLTTGMSGDPLMKELFTETFGAIGTVKALSPAYLVKEYLLNYLIAQDGPQIMRSYLADFNNHLDSFELDEADKTAKAWLDRWNLSAIEKDIDEFVDQAQMLHRIILSYTDRVTYAMLDTFDASGEIQLLIAKDDQEIHFAVTEERLEISSALVSSFRYLAAKQYLKTSYDSLEIEKLNTELASKEIFLEHAKLLAQRIEYAEDQMHGAATAIDETEFREYMQQKTRDELLSENLKSFLSGDDAEEVTVKPPTISEVTDKFNNARINVFASDVSVKEDSLFTFGITNALLMDRAEDGTSITFDATYDFTTNAVNDVLIGGLTPLKGSFELNDIVAVLTHSQMPEEPAEDILYLLVDDGGKNDEAMRAQITAQNLAKQLLLGEFAAVDIKVGIDQIKVLDPVTLTQFEILEAYVDNPVDIKKPIQITFKYNSASKKASEIYSEGEIVVGGTVVISDLAQNLVVELVEQKKIEDAFDQLQTQLEDQGLNFNVNNITIDKANRAEVKDISLTTLPISVSGIYSLDNDNFITIEHELYSAENVTAEEYFEELAYLYIVDFLSQKGIPVERTMIEMEYPFQTINVVGYESNGQTFNFTLDISANRLKDILLIETGAQVASMTFDEFASIVPAPVEEEEEEAEEEVAIEEEVIEE